MVRGSRRARKEALATAAKVRGSKETHFLPIRNRSAIRARDSAHWCSTHVGLVKEWALSRKIQAEMSK